MADCSLIVPIALDKPEYEEHIPHVFLMDDDGVSFCLKSILGLDLTMFGDIYITILKKHDDLYGLRGLLGLQVERLKLPDVHFCLLEHNTRNQAETVYRTIINEHIHGAIYIKDADGFFRSEIVVQNSIAVFPIEQMSVLSPQNKSFVSVDDSFFITNIIEKKVISHFINAGGYCFEDADSFCRYFESLSDTGKKLYLSHIVYAMLLDKQVFRPALVKDWEDFENCR